MRSSRQWKGGREPRWSSHDETPLARPTLPSSRSDSYDDPPSQQSINLRNRHNTECERERCEGCAPNTLLDRLHGSLRNNTAKSTPATLPPAPGVYAS